MNAAELHLSSRTSVEVFSPIIVKQLLLSGHRWLPQLRWLIHPCLSNVRAYSFQVSARVAGLEPLIHSRYGLQCGPWPSGSNIRTEQRPCGKNWTSWKTCPGNVEWEAGKWHQLSLPIWKFSSVSNNTYPNNKGQTSNLIAEVVHMESFFARWCGAPVMGSDRKIDHPSNKHSHQRNGDSPSSLSEGLKPNRKIQEKKNGWSGVRA